MTRGTLYVLRSNAGSTNGVNNTGGRAVIERNEDVARTSHDNTKLRFAQFSGEPCRHVERRVFFRATVTAKRAVVLAPVAGVDDYRGEAARGVFHACLFDSAATRKKNARGRAQQIADESWHRLSIAE